MIHLLNNVFAAPNHQNITGLITAHWNSVERHTARREALRALEILDTAREAAFDEAVELVQIFCRTDGALISLIDTERQWFKAGFGFDASETPLNQSVCVHCLDTDGVVEIRDMTKDDRTRSNPLVIDKPNLRFYAGAAIKSAHGVKVGAICVLDHEPRPEGLKPEQAAFLLAKAHEISGLLLLRLANTNRLMA